MARGATSPAPNPLPKVSFVKVTDEITQQASGVADQIARSYGYNGPSDFQQERHYIRYIEPLESDLAVQVEYDMDEQDQEWVDAVNAERKAQQLDKVSYETFEIVMDRLEKEWFDLTKNIPKSDMALPSEDSTCAICDDSEGENTNAIVFCDGCNLAVHQDCYGVPYIPEGQWLCRKCTVSPENPVSCILCPREGGAFKQTVNGDWVHLLCAIWVPETGVANEVFMEPITGVDKISKQRWKLRCSVCDDRHGACIQCSKSSCFTAFHATCARKEKFLMPMKATQGSEAPALACYCERHLPREQQEARDAALQVEHSDGSDLDGIHVSSKSNNKSARAYAKTYKPGPPLVPRIIVNRILHYISRIQVRHKSEFVHSVCKYWSLKREARRGAPLLKRLHLEPWTALSGSKQQTDEEKTIMLDHMKRLRLDLERLRIIADVVRRRERIKQAQAEAIQDALLHFLFPHEAPLRLAFQKITSYDRQNAYFKTPVSKAEVPDYYDVIKNPMCWDMIDQKLDRHEYLDLAEFKRDVNLVLDNAMTYNEVNTPFYKTAHRIQAAAQAPLAELDKLVHRAYITHQESESVTEKVELESQPDQLETILPPIGDFEPPLDVLKLLVSEESIRQDTNLIVTSTPTEALLNYELPNIRPPPPPPPPQRSSTYKLAAARDKLQKRRYDRRAALKRKREERHAALDASPGFRALRTRAGTAAIAAFEAEAIGTSQSPAAVSAEDQPATEVSTSAGAVSGAITEKPKRQRKSGAHPPPTMPLTVEDVDNRQSFKLFEMGWILAPEQKRGGRAPVERQPLPPPRKRTKTGQDKSQPSNVGPVPATTPAAREEHQAEDIPAVSAPSEPAGFVATKPPGGIESFEPSESVPPTNMPESTTETVIVSDMAPAVSPVREPSTRPEPAIEPDPVIEPAYAGPTHTPEPRQIAPESSTVLEAEAPAEHVDVQEQPPSYGPSEPPLPIVEDVQAAEPVSMDVDKLEIVAPESQVSQEEPSDGIVQASEHQPEPEPEPAPEPERKKRKRSTPPRIIIIEELDTPAIRREKYLRKKAEREAARERAEAEEAAARVLAEPVAGPSRVKDAMEVDGEVGGNSDLTDLSELDESELEEVAPKRGPAPVMPARAPSVEPEPSEPGVIVLKKGERLEGGTLVWAKIQSFPWWPAVVFEDDDPEVPANVAADRPRRRDSGVALVRFYEKNHTNNWAWVKLKNLRYLGEDDTVDAQMLAPTTKHQRWHSSSRRTECRNAYQEALAEMEAEDQTSAHEEADPNANSPATATPGTSVLNVAPEHALHVVAQMLGYSSPSKNVTLDDLVPAAMGADSPMTEVDGE